MLILTRRPGESVLVGHDVIITVTQVAGRQVRIGIEAPKEVKVLRAESQNWATTTKTSWIEDH